MGNKSQTLNNAYAPLFLHCIQSKEFTLAKQISLTAQRKPLPRYIQFSEGFPQEALKFPSKVECHSVKSLGGGNHGKHILTILTGLCWLGHVSERDYDCISRHSGAFHILGLPDRTCSRERSECV